MRLGKNCMVLHSGKNVLVAVFFILSSLISKRSRAQDAFESALLKRMDEIKK